MGKCCPLVPKQVLSEAPGELRLDRDPDAHHAATRDPGSSAPLLPEIRCQELPVPRSAPQAPPPGP